MRLISILFFFLFSITVYAWTKEDHEIFDLVSALEAAEGRGTNFYSHVGVESTATTSEITKAYRKKSLELHPDKNPGVKNIEERFARLGVIAQILRSPEKRERYNFFYKNGVPTWRGTGYYYSRFRPSLIHVIVFLILLTSLFHLLVLKLNYIRDQKRVAYFEQAARVSAGVSTPKEGNGNGNGNGKAIIRRRKVKVPMVEGVERSGTLELIVDGNGVFLPHEDGSLTPLSDLATKPSYFRTWPFLLLSSLLSKISPHLPTKIQNLLTTNPTPSLNLTIEGSDPENDSEDISTPTPTPRTSAKLAQLRGKKSNLSSTKSTPKDSPVTTEVESDDGESEGVNGDVDNGKKKRRSGGGKAAAMRRRKMGTKK